MKAFRRRFMFIGTGLAIVLLLTAFLWPKPESMPPGAGNSSEMTAEETPAVVVPTAFDEWMASGTDRDIERGIALAKGRGEWMREMIRTNPEQAIHEALTLSEWSSLPPEVQEHVEQPFSVAADVRVLIACGEETSETFVSTKFPDGSTMETYVYGRRNAVGSKNGMPIQGIQLDGVGALRPETFQLLEDADKDAALGLFPVAVADPGGESVASLAGGRIFYFKNRAALEEANRRIAELEDLPGPDSGAQPLFDAVIDGGIDFDVLEELAMAAAEAWTGTPRDMYVIMVDFPDITGQPTDPVAFSNSLNSVISQQIWEMSYEKSHIVATVNPTLYHLATPSTNFSSNAEPMHSEAVALVEGDGVDLSPYETVCVIFPYASSIGFAGLADIGGSRMWLNGNTTARVVTHELGHNYGASHASSWEVAGNDPADPAGSRLEYGNFLDIMGSAGLPEGHFNCWHKNHIGWFDATNWQAVATSGTYRTYRSDHYQTSGAIRGLAIDKGGSDQYWIGLRQEFPAYDTFSRGVYLLWKQTGTNRSHLLDTTPQSAGGSFDGGLALGQTYSDPAVGVHVTPVARGGQTPNEWMDITVNLGSFPGNSAPTASLSGPTNLSVRTSALFTVTASDPDGDELAYYWDIGDGQVKPNSPTIPAVWLSSGTATVSCVVSDMKGGTNRVSQTVVFSDPLDNWTQHTSGLTADLLDVALGSGRLVAVGDQAQTAYSDNGTNWTVHASGNIYMGNVYFEGIVYDDSQFVAVGMNYDYSTAPVGWEQVVFTSVDGTYWIERYESDDGNSSNIRFYDVAVGGGIYVAVGDNGTIVRSTDGISWNPVASGSTTNLHGVSYGNGTFVAVGAAGGGGPAVTLTSADGLSWSNHSAGVDLDDWRGFYDVQYCNDRFLASGWHARILHSLDQGQTFSTSMTGNGLGIPGFAYGDGIFFAAGIEKVYSGGWLSFDINLISLDGANWTQLTTASQDDRNAAVFYNGTFITVGDNGAIWQSDPAGSLSSGYAVWQYSNAETLGFDRDPLDDADFDGFLNLVEYAMGSSASDAGSTPASGSMAYVDGYFQVSYARDGIANDVDYVVERGGNLASNDWDSANTVTLEDSETNLTVRSAFPLATQTNEFMRLNIGLK